MTAATTSRSQAHPVTGQPVGQPVDTTPARRPGPVSLDGRYGRVERLAQPHAAALWKAGDRARTHIWTYMSAYGPLADFCRVLALARRQVTLDDPYSYAIVDRSDQALGIATLMEIRPSMGVIGSGISFIRRLCSARRSEPRRSICSRVMRSRRLAIAAMNGSATRSTRPRGRPRCAMVRVRRVLRQHMIARPQSRSGVFDAR
jgi:hypothetical protein